MVERGTSQKERTFAHQRKRINRGDGSTCLSIQDEVAARPQTIETLFVGRCTHTVVNHIHTASGGQFLHFTFEILRGVKDCLVSSGGSCEFSLLRGAGSRQHSGPKATRSLNQQLPHA